MDHKVSLTRGAAVGGAATAYIVDEGMPPSTTIAIWAGLLLGALGTGFGAAGYAFSMENKDKLAEMAASPPPPPPSPLSTFACLEQIFGGINSVQDTLVPKDEEDFQPFYLAPTADGTGFSLAPTILPSTYPEYGLLKGLALSFAMSSDAYVSGLYGYHAATGAYTPVTAPSGVGRTIGIHACETAGAACSASNSHWDATHYQFVGATAGSGKGLVSTTAADGDSAASGTAIRSFKVENIYGMVQPLFTTNFIYKVSGSKGALNTAVAGASADVPLYASVPMDVFYEPVIVKEMVHSNVRYVPKADGFVMFYTDAGATTPVLNESEDYGLTSTLLSALGTALVGQITPMFYSHKINAQCASV